MKKYYKLFIWIFLGVLTFILLAIKNATYDPPLCYGPLVVDGPVYCESGSGTQTLANINFYILILWIIWSVYIVITETVIHIKMADTKKVKVEKSRKNKK